MVNKAKTKIVQQKLNKTTPNYEHYQLRFQTNKKDTQREKKRNETQAATREQSVYHREEVQAKQQQLAAAPNLLYLVYLFLGCINFFFYIYSSFALCFYIWNRVNAVSVFVLFYFIILKNLKSETNPPFVEYFLFEKNHIFYICIYIYIRM